MTQTAESKTSEETQTPTQETTSAKGDIEVQSGVSDNRLMIILAAGLIGLIAIMAFATILILNSNKRKQARRQEQEHRNHEGQN